MESSPLDEDESEVAPGATGWRPTRTAVPSASTTCSASTWLLAEPYRGQWLPPESTETTLPIVVTLRMAQQAAAADRKQELSDSQRAAAQWAEQIERTHGDYWGRRADQLLE